METIKRKCKVIMLSTDDKKDSRYQNNRLFVDEDGLYIPCSDRSKYEAEFDKNIEAKHLCILSKEEEIQIGDWTYWEDCENQIHQITDNYIKSAIKTTKVFKIIATTDRKLKLPLLSVAFLHAFIKAEGKIKEVNIDYISNYGECPTCESGYTYPTRKICNCGVSLELDYIPKVNRQNEVCITSIKDTYTKEEVAAFVGRMQAEGIIGPKVKVEEFNQWLNENL